MVAITGSVAMKNAKRESDLDFLVVLERNRIFVGRSLVTIVLHFLGLRRYGKKISDRACLNYFITADSLEIDLKDIFSASEYSFIVPIIGPELFKKFQLENSWIANYKLNYNPDDLENLKFIKESALTKASQWVGERLLGFDFLEENLKKWEVGRIMRDPRTHQIGSMVLVSDVALIFLPDPQGPHIYDKFQERLAAHSPGY
jgi:predicted nucleotidyltransferase